MRAGMMRSLQFYSGIYVMKTYRGYKAKPKYDWILNFSEIKISVSL